MLTFLYSFENTDLGYTFYVYRDDGFDISVQVKDALNHPVDDPGDQTGYITPDILLGSTCTGTTQIKFYTTVYSPYAYKQYEYNSPLCGYTPATCDLVLVSLNTSDETTEDNNNGTANIFATSSYDIVSYTLSGAGDYSNSTGIFTGLTHGLYNITVTDTNGCVITDIFKIHPFNPDLTDLKYSLEFTGLQSGYDCRVEFHDKKNLYNPDVYPQSLIGGAIPVVRKTANSNEAKEEPICPTSLDISIMMDGSFTVEEFALSDERTWYIKYYVNSELKFQGWLLPDETDDEYKDPNYPIKLTATDGLLSLKGADYADASGVQEYGVFAWAQLIRNCLDQLEYDYGNTVLISSLCFNDTFDNQLWLNIATWSDLLYDDNGNPKKTYDVLTILLRSMGLCIFQHNGTFYMVNWNDFYYIQNVIKQPEWYRAAWIFNGDFTSVTNGDFTLLPRLATVGFQQEVKPINTNHPLRYDKAYSVLEANIDFKYFTLLYANPSFEIGAVEGELPNGFFQDGTGVPGSGLTKTDAYAGDWSFKILSSGDAVETFIENIEPGFTIDQPNKTVNISFVWKVPPCPDYLGHAAGYVFSFVPVFIDGTSGNGYFLQTTSAKTISYIPDYISNGEVPQPQPTEDAWILGGGAVFYSEGNAYSIKGTPTTDFIGWQSYSLQTPALPESGQGQLFIRFYGVKIQLYNTSQYTLGIGGSGYYRDGFYGNSYDGYYLIDDLQITLGDAATGYNKQIGETHSVTNLTNFAKAEKKPVTLDLFTFPSNKRIAGNVFYGTDYLTGIVANTWNYRLTNPVVIDRLPAIQVRKIAKQYQRPAYIFEGDVLFQELNYFAVFLLMGYAGRLFMPYTITWDDKNGTANVVIVEINDSQPQNSYIYNAKYEKSARKIQ